MSALASRDYNKAKAEFEAVLTAQPDHPTAHLNLGIIALIENRPADGLAHFGRSLTIHVALIGRLDCELRLHKLEDARSTAMRLEGMTASKRRGQRTYRQAVGEPQASSATAIPFLRRVPGAEGAGLLGMADEKSGDLNAAASAPSPKLFDWNPPMRTTGSTSGLCF